VRGTRALLLGLLCLPCASQEKLPNLQFSGFGTLGLVGTNTHAVGYLRDNTQPDIAAAIDKPTAGLDSRLGLQLSSRLSENFLATLQVVSKLRYDNTFKPDISLAALMWRPADNLQVRAGVVQYENLPTGDTKNIGYSILWVRPPVEVVGPNGLSRAKGVDVRNTFFLGSGTSLEVGLFGGVGDEKIPVAGLGDWDISGSRGVSAFARLERGGLKVQAAYSDEKVARTLPGDFEAFRQGFRAMGTLLGDPRLNQVADALQIEGVHLHQLQLGAAWEDGPAQAMAFFSHREHTNHLLIPTTNAGFLSFGYRVGQVVPYTMVARAVSQRQALPDTGTLGSLPAYFPPQLVLDGQTLVSGLSELANASAYDQTTWSGGVRWDFRDGADLKFQVDRVHTHNSTAGLAVPDPAAAAAWDGRLTVYSLVLDFIFGGGR
jgi:hypothetical protein